MSLSI